MRHKVLITAPYMHREKEKIQNMLKEFSFEVDWIPIEERLEEEDLLPVIGRYHAILCGDDKITKKVIDAAVNLKVIVKWGTGIDSINKEYAKKKGIKVLRSPDAFTDPVADSALALMLNEARGLFRNDSIFKQGGWEKPQGHMLREKTIGIIGFGNIGRAVAKRLIPFGPKVMVNDIKKLGDKLLKSYNVTSASKDKIYKECNIITLHSDLNPASQFLLNRGAFSKMKKKPYIINTARGPLIKETDLISALRNGLISGVGIDVFEDEPLPRDHIFRSLTNVTASCHNTNSSPSCWNKIHKNSLKMLEEGLNS
ncbi:MAG: NAD(P)-dependent oxidoreductase [bacterium]|nr:NAD(P)-dependent oxidoreductase [bacterium]